MTQEEADREKLAISCCERYAILEENRPVIETLAYSDKYRKLLDEICLDKNKLDEAIKDEQKESIKRVKGEALIEKEDPGAFIFPIRLEGKINLNGVADTDSEVNVMPYRIYMDLGCEIEKKVNRGIEMINHSLAEPCSLPRLENILQSIDEGPFKMGKFREILADGALGPEQDRVVKDLTTKEKERFMTAVKLNRGLKTSNYDQLYAYLKQHKAHANENKMMLEKYTQHAIDPLAFMSNVSLQ
ncbi:hypothetical protein Tco_0438619 [Tanacetum coccineum]